MRFLSLVRAEAHLTYQAPVIHFGTKRWIARHPARPGLVVEVDAPSKAAAKIQGGWRLQADASRVTVQEAFDPAIVRLNRKA